MAVTAPVSRGAHAVDQQVRRGLARGGIVFPVGHEPERRGMNATVRNVTRIESLEEPGEPRRVLVQDVDHSVGSLSSSAASSADSLDATGP